LKDFPRPFWLALFVEGTRFTPAKLLAVQEYVASQGLPAPRNVLIPRTNSPHPRFTCCGCSVELRAPATNSPLLDPFFLVLFGKRREARTVCSRMRIDMQGGRGEHRLQLHADRRGEHRLQPHADRHAGRARIAQRRRQSTLMT
jgi:hypothetical protein